MGCIQCCKTKESDDTTNKSDQNGLRSLFYATTEFDLSRSDSEDDDEENFSLNSIKSKRRQSANKIVLPSNESNPTDQPSPIMDNNGLIN
ncbi:unnamed protein product [Adineta steineri]|uniref:Uncharacterized protein n=1 Tax=Adineta steineri TaxID=433720 RepID=A0A815UDJ8_9BILA|nr:unnamed protein product [Adineta steineri]CAF1648345.1 unnamed protein product [Adineta steineri]